jgi:hypothetical protein
VIYLIVVTWVYAYTSQTQLTIDKTDDCERLRRDLIAESWRQEKEGFPGWTPINAQCMVKP